MSDCRFVSPAQGFTELKSERYASVTAPQSVLPRVSAPLYYQQGRSSMRSHVFSAIAAAAIVAFVSQPSRAAPRVVVISLDGGTPTLVKQFMHDGTIPHDKGLGLLARKGAVAERNITVNPSLTAAAHVALTTGSTAARNDIPSNTFHLVASP